MTAGRKAIKNCLGLVELDRQLTTMARACQILDDNGDTFHVDVFPELLKEAAREDQYRRRIESECLDMLCAQDTFYVDYLKDCTFGTAN